MTDPKMTRFLMSLDDAVDLVVYAFTNGQQGDIFVPKTPAAAIGDLARALVELFEADNEIVEIGTRHGEKLHETLLTREEMARAEDLSGYFRIPVDGRDLNYGKYFFEGSHEVSQVEDYNSANTEMLNVEGIKRTLLRLPELRRELERG